LHHAPVGQGRANATGEPEWGKRSETTQVVFKDELGSAAKQSTAGEFFFVFYVLLNKRMWQITPATRSSGGESGNLRHIKESTSLHLEEQSGSGSSGKGGGLGTDDLFGAFSSVTLHYDGDI